MVSEENEEAVLVPDHPEAHYALVFDPLDGSSNIDCNGTYIFYSPVYMCFSRGASTRAAIARC